MAGTDAKKVLVGAPEQSGVSGAVARAPLGTTIPETARDTLDALTFVRGGYVSSDGVTVTPDLSTTSITDWSGSEVRKLLESFAGTIAFEFIQTGADEATLIFGEDNVEVTAATATHGEQVKIKIGAHLPEAGVWVFSMKDGDALVKVVAPNAQPTTVNELGLVANDAIKYGTELSCYPDADGESIYILTDDGVFSA